MDITVNTIIQRNKEIIHSDMDGDTVMMDAEQGKYFGLDKIATRIWGLLEEEMSVDKVCQKLHKEYDISEQDCLQDVLDFINEMAENNVIEIKKA